MPQHSQPRTDDLTSAKRDQLIPDVRIAARDQDHVAAPYAYTKESPCQAAGPPPDDLVGCNTHFGFHERLSRSEPGCGADPST
jgi:hypothetical protein